MAGRPKGGYRLKDGTPVPGCTTITSRFKESGGLLQWAFQQGVSGADSLYEKRDEAADVGSFVHLLWEQRLLGKEFPAVPEFPLSFSEEQKEQTKTSMGSALRWEEDIGLKITPVETPYVSEVYRFGGTPDAIAIGKRGGSLADWKTGSGIYPETWMQMAAYIHLLKENIHDLDLSDGVHIVRFGKLGEFSHLHIPLEHPGLVLAWEQFQALIGCFDRDKKLKKMT